MEKQIIHSLTDKSTFLGTVESLVREMTIFNAVKHSMNTKDDVITEYYTNHRVVSATLLLSGIKIEKDIEVEKSIR